MSDEPTRPDEPEPAAGVEASPQVDQSNEPVEPTNVQEPEMSTVQIGQADTVPEEKKPEAEESEKAVAPDAPAPDELVQEVAKTESSVKASTEPADSKSEFPLADSNILAELKAGETRAGEAAKAIQALKEQLATNTKKDVMTEEDIQNMEQKQKELMDKMQEFEEITKQIQQLVGLVDVPSSQLGIPKTPMVPAAEDKPKDSTNQLKVQPIDKLPKVIIFGTSDIDEVPRIIVCEPTSARSGKHPLYNQIKNDDVNEKAASKSKITDQGTEDQDQSRTPSPPINQFMNFGYTGRQGNMGPGQPGMMQPGMGQGGMLCPGMGQGGMVQPSFGPPGMVMQPGMGQPGMTQPWTVQPGMMQYLAAQPVWPQLLGLAQPGMPQGRGIEKPRMCSPCGHPRKRKSHKTRDATDSGVKESGQEASRSKTDGDEMKKICRKRKQCICQISGLCTWNTNKPPFPHNVKNIN